MSYNKKNIEEKMEKAIESLKYEFSKIRTGRANPTMLEKVSVIAYGNPSPLNQVALISVVDARQLMVKPFDPSLLKEVEKGINDANLGFNPTNDGEVIRINIPALTEETRKTLTKDVKVAAENAKVKVRQVRQDAMNAVKKDKDFSDDEKKSYEVEIDAITKDFNKAIDEHASKKEQDVMTI